MGAYLDKPRTEKETETGVMALNGYVNLPFAVSSMQGWRKTMEDAHIAMPNLETQYDVPEGTSLYAVFDGHGGKEVAIFCAKYFVKCMTELESFKSKDYRTALIETFHKIDDMLMEEAYGDELHEMSGNQPMKPIVIGESDDEGHNGIDEEPVTDNIAEHDDSDGINPEFRLSNDSLMAEFGPNAKASTDEEEHSETDSNEDDNKEFMMGKSLFSATKESLESKMSSPRSESLRFKQSKETFQNQLQAAKEAEEIGNTQADETEDLADQTKQPEQQTEQSADTSSTERNELDNKMSQVEEKGTLSKAEALNIMFKMLGFNKSAGSTATATKEEPEEEVQPRFTQRFDLRLQTHAGATACVALIIEGKIYVANAGDSRAVLCRDKKAFAMSYDHKPEQQIEKERIEKAGGWVTPMGRVCGNLNLSRCIGDLKYKLNENISKASQIITAEPDVKSVDIQKDDLFLVVACDGVWDIMTNDNIVDFVAKSFVDSAKNDQSGDQPLAMQNTVEQVFNHCICEDPMMDGKGGDNMTAVIVCLKPMEEVVSTFWMA